MTKAQTESQIVDFVRQQRAVKAPFEIVAGGTRRGIGAPTGALPQLAVSALTGIVNYEPEELLCTVAPATFAITRIRPSAARSNSMRVTTSSPTPTSTSRSAVAKPGRSTHTRCVPVGTLLW